MTFDDIAAQANQLRFEVIDVETAGFLGAAEPRNKIDDSLEMLSDRMTGNRALRSDLRQIRDPVRQTLDLRLPFKHLTPPCPPEVAPLHKHRSGSSQTFQRPIAVGWVLDRCPAERAA